MSKVQIDILAHADFSGRLRRTKKYPGHAVYATTIENLRRQNPNGTLLLDAGDEFSTTFWGGLPMVKAVSLAAVCLILGTQASRISALFIPTHLYENSTRCVLEEAKADYAIPEGAVCAIYGSEVTEDWGYHTYMGRYIFQTFDTEAFAPSAENLPEFDTLTEKFDYLVVMDSDPSLEQYLTENGLTPGQTVYHLS